jgi:putative hydrolase of the HAD superfamily
MTNSPDKENSLLEVETTPDKPPKVIFLDAVGTLFGVRDSVGAAYAQVAQDFGVNLEAKAINTAFYQAFSAATPLVFPQQEPIQIQPLEFQWWKEVAVETFKLAGVIEQFTDFDRFFQALYKYFATAQPWEVYPDVVPALTYWRSREIKLGILSNFDSRIYEVLTALELNHFFSSVTISSEAGAAKPDPQIFTTALDKYNCEPTSAWHIGDSWQQDYQGAKQAGIRAIWIQR